MRLIVAGSRTITDFDLVDLHIGRISGITEIVSGACRGVDLLAERSAVNRNIPIKRFCPEWDKYGKAAGPKRNAQMAKYADQLLLIWDGESLGSANMKRQMELLGKPITEVIV